MIDRNRSRNIISNLLIRYRYTLHYVKSQCWLFWILLFFLYHIYKECVTIYNIFLAPVILTSRKCTKKVFDKYNHLCICHSHIVYKIYFCFWIFISQKNYLASTLQIKVTISKTDLEYQNKVWLNIINDTITPFIH